MRGFRAFGAEPRTLQLDEPLVVVHAGNSQGKTSLAEAIEFLISGRSSRRELLGGAKAEYNDSLRNAHLGDGDMDVYVEATLRGADGVTHQVRRELISDFGRGSECESRLLLDGTVVDDLALLGVGLADPPVRAPVLLQHILRHVLSTEPKQRVGYFKALLSLTDLDHLRDRVKMIRARIEAEEPGAALRLVNASTDTSIVKLAATTTVLTKKPATAASATEAIDSGLLEAGVAIMAATTPDAGDQSQAGAQESHASDRQIATVDDLARAVKDSLAAEREQSFPLAPFDTNANALQAPTIPDLTDYATALAAGDRQAARIAPVLEAVLTVGDYAELDEPQRCPVCGTEHALTPQRIAMLREHLERTQAVDEEARSAARKLGDAGRDLDQVTADAKRAIPEVAGWDGERQGRAEEMLGDLGIDVALLTHTRLAARAVSDAADTIDQTITRARKVLDDAAQAVASREPPPDELARPYERVADEVQALAAPSQTYADAAAALISVVEAAARDQPTVPGLAELAGILERRKELVSDVVAEAQRQKSIKRIAAAEKALREGAGKVLDARFEQMSDTITDWWTSIRPEELVGFGGIKRRAGGALFVNLIAALRAEASSDPIEREALGVYSDSQLNALGLSIFLARTGLLDSPIVVLDDPIPGSDADHRYTFVQNTLGRLLDSGVQVVLTTFDSKLAELSQSNHDWRGLVAYELTLLDAIAGTEATQTSDVFGRLLLEAEDHLHSPTPRGRRAACNSLRAAAERLAKQIVATGRTEEGHPTSVGDVDTEASILGDLVPLVSGHALENREKGQWRSFAKVLNPGNHDDEVPSTMDLKQVRGNLRRIAKDHRAHWPAGLLL